MAESKAGPQDDTALHSAITGLVDHLTDSSLPQTRVAGYLGLRQRRPRRSTLFTDTHQHLLEELNEVENAPVAAPVSSRGDQRRGSAPSAGHNVEQHVHGVDEGLMALKTPAVRPAPTPGRAVLASILEEARGKAGFGLVRYEQHGEGARRGEALRVRLQNSKSWLVKHFGYHELFTKETWRAGVTEMFGQLFFNFLQQSLILAAFRISGAFNPDTPANAYPPPAVYHTPIIVMGTVVLASLLIFSMAPLSGAHFNPLITFSVVTTGLMTGARGLVYLVFQFAGGFLGSWFVWIIADRNQPEVAMTSGAGCPGPEHLSTGEALLAEFLCAFFILFVAYQLLFDPQQFTVFGPVVGPVLLTFGIGLLITLSTLIYPGLGLNVTRCLPNAIIWGNALDTDQWVYVVGDALACIAHAIMYAYVFVPHHLTVLEDAAEDAEKPTPTLKPVTTTSNPLSEDDTAAAAPTDAAPAEAV